MSKRILCIDDEADVLDILRAVLKTKGHTVVIAQGGEEGLALADRGSFDLITVDLMMPRMSGMEVIKRLRANERTAYLPIVVVTAVAHNNEKFNAEVWKRGLQVQEIVEKPFDPLDLLGRVEAILRASEYVSVRRAMGEDLGGSVADGAARQQAAPAPATDLSQHTPSEVVRAFVESWNEGEFATEFETLGEEMTGGLTRAEYTHRRTVVRDEERDSLKEQRVLDVVTEDVSVNLAKVVIDREDRVNGRPQRRKEQYALKKTMQGWKIVSFRLVRE